MSTDGDITTGTVTLTAPVSQFQIFLFGTAPGDYTIPGTAQFGELRAFGGGTVTLSAGANPVVIGGLGPATNLVLSTTNVATGVSVINPLTTTGTITLNTPRFETTSDITAASITVQSLGALTVVGNVSNPVITGTTPPAGLPGAPSNPAAIIFNTGIGANLNLFSNLTFNGDVELNNFNGTTTSNNGSLLTGNNNIKLTTNIWTQIGTGNIVANNLIFGGQTIANTSGNVNLPGNTIFNGTDLAIISNQNVNLGNFLIETSPGGSGNAGNITILAGFNFAPDTLKHSSNNSSAVHLRRQSVIR